MSYEVGMKIMNLEPTERVGRIEYLEHDDFVRAMTGIKFDSANFEDRESAYHKFYNVMDYDLRFHVNDGSVPWNKRGRVTEMGHAVYMQHGVDFIDNRSEGFKNVDDVLNFDAAEEYGLPDAASERIFYQGRCDQWKKVCPNMILPGGYYKSIISGAIQSFGWDMLLQALGTDAKRFGEYVLEGFFKLTLEYVKIWAQTDIKVFIQHDDMVWTEGPFYNPQWYRQYLFPRYKKLWEPLRKKGIKVLFCSDGTYTEFVDDIASAGADGFILEPTTSLEYIAEKYGKTHVLVGNADCRILTFGNKADIRKEVERCMRVGKPCPGFMMAVGNHIPANIPIDNVRYYFESVDELGKR